MKLLLTLIGFLSLASSLRAELSLPHFFSDHMVLQRERSAAIWGTADADAKVTVSFKGESATATAGPDGKWQATIATGMADAEGAVLTVESGGEKIELADVLVGEVWFASGQSNMVFTMDRVPAYEGLISESTHPGLRFFNAPTVTAAEPQTDIDGEWTLASPETVP